MTAMGPKPLLCVTMLLAVAMAAPDTVITVREVIPCSVVWSDTNLTRLKMPNGSVRMLYTRDIREIRLSDPGRFPDLANQLPPASATQDSSQPTPQPPAPATSLPYRPMVVDSMPRKVSPAAMAAKCRDMKVVLRDCGRRNDTVFDLVRDIDKEQKELRRIWPEVETYSGIYVTVAGLAGCGIGSLIAFASNPCGANPAGPVVGCVAGSLAGAAFGARRGAKLVADHRGRVNDLVRRVNIAAAPQP